MGTSGDKIVLLDGMGSGSGSAANGLLSMIPGMFTSLLGGNKMDPNLVAALMNGRNNQDQFGGANGWWLWIIVLFWLWGGRGFGNGFGNGNECCANGLPAQLNNDYGRELLMQAIQGNRSAIDQISNALNCSTSQLQNAICNVQGAIDKVAGQVGMTSQAVINAVQQQGCEIGNQISACCCNLQSAMASGFNNIQHDGGVYDHYGKERDGMMEELERRERDLERRERELERNERELEKRQRHHEREDEMYRKGWFGERDIRDEYDGTEPYMRRGRRSRYY